MRVSTSTGSGGETDIDLMKRWRDGDSSAAQILVKRYFSLVYRFFANKLDQGVEDLVQHTFLACVEGQQRFDDERGTAFRAYLLGIARNVLLKHYRQHQRRFTKIDPLNVPLMDLRAANPSRVVVARREQEVLMRALHRLPLDYQITMELFYWEDLSTPEIAKVLGVAEGTIKARLHRARHMLMRAIEELEPSGELRNRSLWELGQWTNGLRNFFKHST